MKKSILSILFSLVFLVTCSLTVWGEQPAATQPPCEKCEKLHAKDSKADPAAEHCVKEGKKAGCASCAKGCKKCGGCKECAKKCPDCASAKGCAKCAKGCQNCPKCQSACAKCGKTEEKPCCDEAQKKHCEKCGKMQDGKPCSDKGVKCDKHDKAGADKAATDKAEQPADAPCCDKDQPKKP